MLTRRFTALLLLALVLAGCANNGTSVEGPSSVASASASTPASPTSGSSSPGSSSPGSATSASPTLSTVPTATGAQTTISGTVAEGVEPKCLILRDSSGSHVLYFDDPALRSAAKVGARVTLTGRSEPRMMTTCQQGVAFVVSSVTPG